MNNRSTNSVDVITLLLKKVDWEITALKADFQKLKEICWKAEQKISELAVIICSTEKILREIQIGEIRIDKKQQVDGFFKLQHYLLNQENEEFTKLKANLEEVLERLNEKKKSYKALEKYKEKIMTNENLFLTRQSLRESDNSWLLQVARERSA